MLTSEWVSVGFNVPPNANDLIYKVAEGVEIDP